MQSVKLKYIRYVTLLASSMVTPVLEAEWEGFVRPEIGFLKYHIPRMTLQDVAGNLDTLVPVTSKLAPLVHLCCGVSYDDLRLFRSEERTKGRIGFAVEHVTRKNDPILTDYLDTGTTTASLEGRQDIQATSIFLLGEYDAWHSRWFSLYLAVGAGAVHNPFTTLRLYEKSNEAFIGQALEPRYFNPTGYLGLGLKAQVLENENIHCAINYRLGATQLNYRTNILQSKPDATASVAAHNAYELFHDLKLQQAPHGTLISHTFSLAVQIDF